MAASMLLLLCTNLFGGQIPGSQVGDIQGRWKVTSLIDDGEPIPLHQVRQNLSSDGIIVVDNQTVTVIMPGQRKRVLLYRTDPTAYPKSLDITSNEGLMSKGIYRLDGDVLMLCIAAPDNKVRPFEFSADVGSNCMLIVLSRDRPTTDSGSILPGQGFTPPAPVQPAVNRDVQYYNQLIGTWGHQDKDEIVYNTLNADGSFSNTRKAKGVFKKLFDDETRTTGTWKVENGFVVVRVTASTDKHLTGQVRSFKINSVSATDAVFLGETGQARREWKVR